MKSLNSASAVLCRCTAADKKEKIMVTQFNTIMVLKAVATTEYYSVRDNNVTGTWKKAKKKKKRIAQRFFCFCESWCTHGQPLFSPGLWVYLR